MCSIEKYAKGFSLIRFFLNKILQTTKFKLFVWRDKFSITAQIFLKFATVKHNRNVQKMKNYFEKQLKNLLADEVENLASLWHIGTLAYLLAGWHVRTQKWEIGAFLASCYMSTQTTLSHIARDLANSFCSIGIRTHNHLVCKWTHSNI